MPNSDKCIDLFRYRTILFFQGRILKHYQSDPSNALDKHFITIPHYQQV